MPNITNQEKLFQEYDLKFVSKGPKNGMWHCHYLRCPVCGYYVLKGSGYDECLCGNISIDSDYLRVTVSKTSESEIETFNAIKKKRDI